MHQSAKSNRRRPARSNDLRAKTWPTVLGLQPPRYSIAKSGGDQSVPDHWRFRLE
jgi:hypothetical protein